MHCPKCDKYMDRTDIRTDGYVCIPCSFTLDQNDALTLRANQEHVRQAKSELMRCGIPWEVKDLEKEYFKQVTGKLGDFVFGHGGRGYWIVNGPVPIAVAWKLYYTSIGKTDIRVAGHCACPAPVFPWANFYDEAGLKLYRKKDDPEEQRKSEENEAKFLDEGAQSKYRYANDVEGESVHAEVDLYHIDTELGLYVFVQTLKEEGVIQ